MRDEGRATLNGSDSPLRMKVIDLAGEKFDLARRDEKQPRIYSLLHGILLRVRYSESWPKSQNTTLSCGRPDRGCRQLVSESLVDDAA